MKFDSYNTSNSIQDSLKYIIYELESNPDFYECDIEYEYTSFEESLKEFCDSDIRNCLENNENDIVLDALVSIIESINVIESDMFYENFFRPVELLTYYFGRLILFSEGAMKNRVYNWMYRFIEENEHSMISEEYFKPFIEGDGIYHADNYYTDYDDFKKVISIYK